MINVKKLISINDEKIEKIVQFLKMFGMHPECINDDILVPNPEFNVSRHIVDSIKNDNIKIDTTHIILGV